ncbi:hypothetical protein ACQJBY_045235 [Aegilops geniculata]
MHATNCHRTSPAKLSWPPTVSGRHPLQKPGDSVPVQASHAIYQPFRHLVSHSRKPRPQVTYVRRNENMAQSRTTAVALLLIAVLVAAASVPAATAFGCYDDCYERCANGAKEDPACTKMCGEACGVGGKGAGAAGGAPAA